MSDFISSRDNPLFKELRALQATGSKGQKARLSSGRVLLEGIHIVQAWVSDPALGVLITSDIGIANPEIDDLVRQHCAVCPDTRVIHLDAGLWGELSELANAPQIAGLLSLPESLTRINPSNQDVITGDVLVLDRIQDAGNAENCRCRWLCRRGRDEWLRPPLVKQSIAGRYGRASHPTLA